MNSKNTRIHHNVEQEQQAYESIKLDNFEYLKLRLGNGNENTGKMVGMSGMSLQIDEGQIKKIYIFKQILKYIT